MKLAKPDLTRTKAALDAYDQVRAAFDAQDPRNDDWSAELSLELAAAVDRAAAAVGEAFALDTADRNDPAVARTIAPNDPWLRRLVAETA